MPILKSERNKMLIELDWEGACRSYLENVLRIIRRRVSADKNEKEVYTD